MHLIQKTVKPIVVRFTKDCTRTQKTKKNQLLKGNKVCNLSKTTQLPKAKDSKGYPEAHQERSPTKGRIPNKTAECIKPQMQIASNKQLN